MGGKGREWEGMGGKEREWEGMGGKNRRHIANLKFVFPDKMHSSIGRK